MINIKIMSLQLETITIGDIPADGSRPNISPCFGLDSATSGMERNFVGKEGIEMKATTMIEIGPIRRSLATSQNLLLNRPLGRLRVKRNKKKLIPFMLIQLVLIILSFTIETTN